MTPVNDPPVLTGDLTATVAEGGTYLITGADLGFTDPDDTAAGVTFTVSACSTAWCKVNGVTPTTFTGAHLAAGQVSFVHNGTETTAASFQVGSRTATRTARRPAQTFNFTVTPVNDPPVLTGDLTATVAEGGTYLITGADLGFTDPDERPVLLAVDDRRLEPRLPVPRRTRAT